MDRYSDARVIRIVRVRPVDDCLVVDRKFAGLQDHVDCFALVHVVDRLALHQQIVGIASFVVVVKALVMGAGDEPHAP